MMNIDLCKLRTGDVVFSLYPALTSFGIAAGTASLVSHAAIVVYPDIWFETNGLGSGFKVIEKADCYQHPSGGRSAIASLEYIRLNALRLAPSVIDETLLGVIAKHIVYTYPRWIEFLPLIVPFKFFPSASERLVKKFVKGDQSGGYCSQMIFRILKDVYGLSGPPNTGEHIAPGRLRQRLKRMGAKQINVVVGNQYEGTQSDSNLNHKYQNFVTVSSKLGSYQYHHNRASFEEALSKTFSEMNLNLDPSNYDININALRTIITRPKYFNLHRTYWPRWYS